jgi:hypothetical protein
MHEGGVSHARSLRVLHSEICQVASPCLLQPSRAQLHRKSQVLVFIPPKQPPEAVFQPPRMQAALPDRLTAPEEVDHLFQAPTRHTSPD